MFSLFKDRTAKKLKKKHSMLLEQAMQAQRRGDIRMYSKLTAEAEDVFNEFKQASEQQS
ncbi:Lacal_2735 family protein [Grimontia sp. S25]|uniref:Lacal_2735 family protein n=1 Tax=Grimontia sedimenti TaxID=2711294 RepID=A0A6M1RR44_9GAMM|nr:Lacal_2735 family protein [Grimontia sedimenti]